MNVDNDTAARLSAMSADALRQYPTPPPLRDLVGSLMEKHGTDAADLIAAATHSWCLAKFRRDFQGKKPPPMPTEAG